MTTSAQTQTRRSDGAFNATLGLVATAVTTPAYGVVDAQYDFGFVAIALGNRGDHGDATRAALEGLRDDVSPAVREAAEWALGRRRC